jgi:AraC-like DNA-binding protein
MQSTDTESIKLWKSGMSGVELFSARLLHHQFSKHMHEEYTIGMNDGGLGCFSYRGETYQSYPGSFNLINPGEVHTGQADSNDGWAFHNLYISVPRVEQILAQLEWKNRALPYFSKPVVLNQSLRLLFDRLFKALSEPNSQLAQQTLMIEGLSQLFLNHAETRFQLRSPQSEKKAITLTQAYLKAHYAENISIDALAQLVGLSPYYLIRSFHKQVGLPPHSYQCHWQLVQAKRSLHTSKPLSEIAIEHGFYDQSHLNRKFKQAFGITPGQYRKSNSVQYSSSEHL